MKIEPYLFFEGRSEEAIEFYKSAVGAKVNRLVRFKDSPEEHAQPATDCGNKVMHASLTIGETEMFLTDGHCRGNPVFSGITLSLTAASDSEAERIFTGLSAGGHVSMPLTNTFFARKFAMLTDRFGVAWMIIAD
jgi:PhnB protein